MNWEGLVTKYNHFEQGNANNGETVTQPTMPMVSA